MHSRYLNSTAFRWTLELVGTPRRLLMNIAIFSFMGIGCLVAKSSSPFLIVFFGGLIPCLLNYCLHSLTSACIDKIAEKSGIITFNTRLLRFMFWIDIAIIILLSSLILSNVLSSSIFKVVACPLIPAIQLIGMRGLLIFYLT